MMFQNVGFYWIIHSKKELKFGFEHHFPSCILDGPWYNTKICLQLHGSYFEYCVSTSRRDRYYLMFSIEYHYIDHPTANDDAISDGDIPLPPDSKKTVLVSFGLTLNFIDSWLQSFKTNYLPLTSMYYD